MPISRLYDSNDDAMAAVAELKQIVFARVGYHLITAADASEAPMANAGIAPADAEHLAEKLRGGGTLLIVDPPFGAAGSVTTVLARSRPHDVGDPKLIVSTPPLSEQDAWKRDGATPFSAALGYPVLLNDPTPLSTYLKWPTLSRTQTGKAGLSGKAAPLSSLLGLKLLSDVAAPFSAKIGRAPLIDNPAPLSTWRRWKVLLSDPAPLSSRLGLKLLTKNPPPRPALSHNAAPFSRLLGLSVLLSDRRPPS